MRNLRISVQIYIVLALALVPILSFAQSQNKPLSAEDVELVRQTADLVATDGILGLFGVYKPFGNLTAAQVKADWQAFSTEHNVSSQTLFQITKRVLYDFEDNNSRKLDALVEENKITFATYTSVTNFVYFNRQNYALLSYPHPLKIILSRLGYTGLNDAAKGYFGVSFSAGAASVSAVHAFALVYALSLQSEAAIAAPAYVLGTTACALLLRRWK